MILQGLIDYLTKVPECSGRVIVERDEFYGLHVKSNQEHGYRVSVMVKNATHYGMGLTVDEAVEKLGEKLTHKFKV